MFGLNKILGRLTNNNEYKISQIQPIVDQINSLESKFEKFSDRDISEQTEKWQKQLRREELSKEDQSKILDEILPEAFALVREAAKRTMNQRHRDVQLIGGIVLHQGKVAEQKTGEGKTLTATLPLYLNSLTGRGVHLVTPNDYLSKHGAGWYGLVYTMLGVSVGVISDRSSFQFDKDFEDPNVLDEYSKHLKPVERLDAYKTDITYGTNHEFGFDYLKDNMSLTKEGIVQVNPVGTYGEHYFAIVDEVDSILIDVARTPLIISGPKDQDTARYYDFAKLAEGLVRDTDYDIDEKDRLVTLTEIGIRKVERKLGVENLYEKDFETVHHVENALKAKGLYERDKDYVVQNGQVIIVDQNTGRLLQGTRWSDGLHQAVEAKEGLQIQAESKTVATISYQNYFRLYDKLAGMTGTAETEAEELFKIYTLDVVSIPTFRDVQRVDKSDLVYKTEAAKYRAVARDIAERHKNGQPVLVGTTSVEKSQLLSNLLKRLKIPHDVLNAKQHDQEAVIIAQAGKKGSVTVSTNMAGRGVDIILGGDPFDQRSYDEIIELGGLYVIGTERHESRRIDNQLRGRSGRQGDPGESRFYLSLQDDLLRIFGGERIESVMGRFGIDENIPIEARLISRSIENAQKKVEGINFDRRKSVVDYDDVMNVQRESIYKIRRRILTSNDSADEFLAWMESQLEKNTGEKFLEIWKTKREKHGDEVWSHVVKRIGLEVISVLWMEHIDTMADLRDGVRLRGYGQVDPLVEYRREGREKFEQLYSEIWHSIADRVSKIEVRVAADVPVGATIDRGTLNYNRSELESVETGVADEARDAQIQTSQIGRVSRPTQPIINNSKVGRNDPCPCGSGKKFKNCHGR